MFKTIREMQDRKVWSTWYNIALKNGATKQQADYVAAAMLIRSRKEAK